MEILPDEAILFLDATTMLPEATPLPVDTRTDPPVCNWLLPAETSMLPAGSVVLSPVSKIMLPDLSRDLPVNTRTSPLSPAIAAPVFTSTAPDSEDASVEIFM